jgi:acyl-CoA dehydrogenase
MDFELSEELKMIQSLARDFVDGRLKPLERDILGKSADLSDAHAYLSDEKEAELMKQVKEMGLWGLGVPAEMGGAGLDTLGVCLVEEELATTIVPFRFGDVTPILFDCDKAQQDKYFKPALDNEKRPYIALMENAPDLAGMQTKAEKAGSQYSLNGKKYSLSRAGKNYFAVAFAKTTGGISCFLVDKETPGFTISSNTERNGWLSRVREPLVLTFENCKVALENMLGEEGKAFKLGKKWLPQRRIVRSARSIGTARRLLEEAANQAQSSSAFGQPASKRISVRNALADMAAGIHAARLMVYEAAAMSDAAKEIHHQAALVKLQTSRMLRGVVDMAAHIFNGPSCAGQAMEKLCRHALENHTHELALEKQRNVIAGNILKGLKV